MAMPSLAARPLLSSLIENHLQRLIGPGGFSAHE